MELEATLKMLEYYIDLYYYEKEFELREELFEAIRYRTIMEDFNNRIIFVQNLDKTKWKVEGLIPSLINDIKERQESDEYSEYGDFPFVGRIFDENGNPKTIEEVGYKAKPMPVFNKRPRHKCPIRIIVNKNE